MCVCANARAHRYSHQHRPVYRPEADVEMSFLRQFSTASPTPSLLGAGVADLTTAVAFKVATAITIWVLVPVQQEICPLSNFPSFSFLQFPPLHSGLPHEFHYVVQVDLKTTSSCLSLSNTEILRMHHYALLSLSPLIGNYRASLETDRFKAALYLVRFVKGHSLSQLQQAPLGPFPGHFSACSSQLSKLLCP